MHLSAALDLPQVAIFGPTDPVTTPPYSRRALLVREPTECSPCLLRHCPIDHRCMTRVTVGRVIDAVRQQLHA
jgi:heptosyltransferase-2